MSASTSHAEEHGHGHSGADHVPHVLPMKVYLATWGTLLFLTVVTVAASYLNIGHTGNLIVAMLIATIKATTVAAIFMHLRWDHKFHTIIFLFSIIFLAVFIGFTLSDTQFRGEAESMEGQNPVDIKDPWGAQRKGDLAPVAPAGAEGAAAPAGQGTATTPAAPHAPQH